MSIQDVILFLREQNLSVSEDETTKEYSISRNGFLIGTVAVVNDGYITIRPVREELNMALNIARVVAGRFELTVGVI